MSKYLISFIILLKIDIFLIIFALNYFKAYNRKNCFLHNKID